MKTHEEHARRVKLTHGDAIEIVGRYTHSKTRVRYRCRHGEFEAFPGSVEGGAGCRKCGADKRRLTHDQYVARVREIHGDRVRVVDRFVNSHTKIRHECPDHGVWAASPANVVHSRSGCRKCYVATLARRDLKSHATYTTEVAERSYEVLDPYCGAHTSIRHRCKEGHTWEAKPNSVLTDRGGCPLCDQSQYKRRPIQVGNRTVMVQGSEGRATQILLEDESVDPTDLAFVKSEGLPTFRYRFAGRWRVYIPDIFRISLDQVIEVKSAVTLGLYNEDLYAQVKAKARAALRAGHSFRLMVIHRGQLIDMGTEWHKLSWSNIVERFRKRARNADRRLRRNRSSKS